MPELTGLSPLPPLPPRTPVLHRTSALIGLPLVAGVVLGALAGLGWELLAPVVTLPKTAGGLVLDETSGARLFAFDGWFAIVAIVGGLILGWCALPLVRRQGWPAVVAVAVAAVLAGLLQWWLGDMLRPGANAAAAPVGSQVAVPLAMTGHALLGLWPLATALVMAVTSLLSPAAFDGPNDA